MATLTEAMATLPDARQVAADTHALYELAVEKMHRRLFRDAMDDLEVALGRDPGHALCLSSYGVCLAHEKGAFEEALRCCKHALQLLPHNPLLEVNLGKVYRLKGDNAAAHRTFLHAWYEDKRHPAPATELARMGIRRRPPLGFLPRSHWCNRCLGRVRAGIERTLFARRAY